MEVLKVQELREFGEKFVRRASGLPALCLMCLMIHNEQKHTFYTRANIVYYGFNVLVWKSINFYSVL